MGLGWQANWAIFIIFSSNHKSKRGFPFNLYMIDINGQNLKQITFDTMFDAFPVFSNDGESYPVSCGGGKSKSCWSDDNQQRATMRRCADRLNKLRQKRVTEKCWFFLILKKGQNPFWKSLKNIRFQLLLWIPVLPREKTEEGPGNISNIGIPRQTK